MTADEIRAELRRSACEDETPWLCDPPTFSFAVNIYVDDCERMLGAPDDDLRTFYLLVAEAM